MWNLTEDSRVNKEREIELIRNNLRKNKQRGTQKNTLIDVSCESNMKTVVEEHF